jgi:hypothetical protein
MNNINFLEKQIDIQNGIINDLIKKLPVPKPKPVHVSLGKALFSYGVNFLDHQKRRLFRVLIRHGILSAEVFDSPEPIVPESITLSSLRQYLINSPGYHKKTICFFVHHDQKNEVSNEDYLYIDHLVCFCDLVFITNSVLPEKDLDRVKKKCRLVIKRPNYGFDFGAWKDGLYIFGFEQLKIYEQLLLVNNSCYAPVFRLEHVFSAMDDAGVDFWGMTGQPENHNFPEHIQSYFMVFSNAVLSDPCFELFWRRVNYELVIKNVIYRYEVLLTAYFRSFSYKYGAFCRVRRGSYDNKKDHDIIYILYHDPLYLVEQGMPLIKKKSSLSLDQYYKLLHILYNDDPAGA